MQFGELKSAKKMFLFCLLAFAALAWFQGGEAPPAVLKGVVGNVVEQDGLPKALSLDVDGERYVVKFTPEYLRDHPAPRLERNQEVEIKATRFKAVKQGVTCEFVELVKAGPVREGLATPQGDEPLPVDDLKPAFGNKGM